MRPPSEKVLKWLSAKWKRLSGMQSSRLKPSDEMQLALALAPHFHVLHCHASFKIVRLLVNRHTRQTVSNYVYIKHPLGHLPEMPPPLANALHPGSLQIHAQVPACNLAQNILPHISRHWMVHTRIVVPIPLDPIHTHSLYTLYTCACALSCLASTLRQSDASKGVRVGRACICGVHQRVGAGHVWLWRQHARWATRIGG